ncbi:MAG TPA: S8 family serine peptidase [Chitinophagaceae bacterium]|nr:S8 family serine peptidase [Chitinophagaceae bacterium]
MRYLLFCLFIFWETIGLAQNRVQQDKAITGVFADTANPVRSKELFSTVDSITSKYFLIKIYSDHANSFKKQFKKQIKRQLNVNWFIIKVERPAIQNNAFIEQYFVANNNWKLSPTLLNKLNELPPDKNFIFLVEVNDCSSFTNFINQHASQASILSAHNNEKIFRVKTNFSFITKTLIGDESVISVDLRLNTPKEESVINDYDNSVNGINLFFAKYPAVNGEGLTVSVKENLFDTTDIDFKGRYKPTTLNSSQITSHATTMTTLIGGGGNSFYTGKGIAWGSNLSSSDFTILLPETNSTYRQYNISVQNHSYGVGVENFYGSDAAAYDQSMIDNPSLLHIFSAGNSGDLADSIGQYKDLTGFANITGSFKQAKNILVVGSVDSFYNVPLLSSKGPAYDGRIKPELVAYGNDGSSGAAAITSGTSLAVQSAYAIQHNDSLPANALVKAIIINSADDILNQGPDFFSGYGNVNTYRAAKDMLSGNFFSGTVRQDETKDFNISIPVNAKNLKVTLVWNDAPAQANAFTALVNDLDLQLEKRSDNTIFLPWDLNSTPNVNSLNQLPERKRDSLNVVEQITIDNPAAGNYIIHVKGYDVSTTVQSFYVVYRWDTANTFQFISPAATDHFTSGSNSIFRWNSTYAKTSGKLEFSIDNGATWNLINANVDLSKKYYQWVAPDTFVLALARMTIGSDVYVSGTFSFSTQLYPHVGFNCTDSVLIYWDKVKGINKYEVYQLGSKYLEPVTILADTTIVLRNNTSPYVAVTTVLDNNHTGVNSYTFNYNTQGVACYISNFLADLNANNNALLQLALGTIFNINSVQFQELTPNGWNTISTIQPVTITNLSYKDNSLHNGINTYRAIVMLNNGNIIYSSTVNVYYFSNNIFVMMPNPLPRNQNLTILSNNFTANTLVMYDMMGRKVLQKEISETREDISIAHLVKGMYIVMIFNNNKKLFNGKLLIE